MKLDRFVALMMTRILCFTFLSVAMATMCGSSQTVTDNSQLLWCDDSPNTTISCFARKADNSTDEVCLNIAENFFHGLTQVGQEKCISTKGTVQKKISLEDQRGNIYKITARQNGSETHSVQLNLNQKVIPDPPVNVRVIRTGNESFNVTFDFPDSWGVRSTNIYEIERHIPSSGADEDSKTDELFGPENERSVTTSPKLKIFELPGHTEVCYRVRFKYARYGTVYGNFSSLSCNFTITKVPSGSPLNLTKTEDSRINGRKERTVTLSWDPPQEDDRNGIITGYKLLIVEHLSRHTVREKNVSGRETTVELEDPYIDYDVLLYASTSAGWSTIHAVLFLKGFPPPNIVLYVLAPSFGTLTLLLLCRIAFVLRKKMLSRHLPEPYIMPEARMIQYLTRRRPPTIEKEKEVFDVLKLRPETTDPGKRYKLNGETFSKEVDTEDKTVKAMTSKDDRHSTGEIFSTTDSGVSSNCDGTEYLGSGVSTYNLSGETTQTTDVMERKTDKVDRQSEDNMTELMYENEVGNRVGSHAVDDGYQNCIHEEISKHDDTDRSYQNCVEIMHGKTPDKCNASSIDVGCYVIGGRHVDSLRGDHGHHMYSNVIQGKSPGVNCLHCDENTQLIVQDGNPDESLEKS
ncbi:uncharacterized protein [Apostichopus japonicus]|uniref:uncharacterized protein n=1 Tax=Stichopus japonicus TaxID=307972 RepID=UPI003AB4072A